MTALVIDTSAILAIALGEPKAAACAAAAHAASTRIVSAGTLAEILIVAGRAGVTPEVSALLDRLAPEIAPVDAAAARRAAAAYARFGKGLHPARLNYGDCFAYAEAAHRGLPLLFVGDDFARTDAAPAI